jgi:cytosine/adenosine deaminase-related metal-dependent hydrolase
LENLIVVRPDWLVPIERPPIRQGFLVLRHNQIQHLGQDLPSQFENVPQMRLADYAILPGLINSHCHLEFSDLAMPISAEKSFAGWIQSVIRHRATAVPTPAERVSSRQAAMDQGIQESYECGVRWIVDMTTSPWQAEWVEASVLAIAKATLSSAKHVWAPTIPISVQHCIELVDVNETRLEQTRSFAVSLCESQDRQKTSFSPLGPMNHAGGENTIRPLGQLGLAPHSPYTASTELTRWSQRKSFEQHRLVAMHLAESLDEMQWIEKQEGPFASLMRPFLNENYRAGLGSITERLHCLSQSWRSLVVHGNYLTDSELAYLGLACEEMAVVHCPRTHAHFGHDHSSNHSDRGNSSDAGYPMQERIQMGVRHFLGTDSRASNPNLNLWSEAQSVRATQRGVSSLNILQMITTDPAEFLQLPGGIGRIQVGSQAGLTAVKLNKCKAATIYDCLLSPETTAQPLEKVLLAEPISPAASEIEKLR